jgi:hypothetical protein
MGVADLGRSEASNFILKLGYAGSEIASFRICIGDIF